MKKSNASFPTPDLQWMEDRFWVWVHYGALKIGRGELFETIDFISFLRQNVIGSLALMKSIEMIIELYVELREYFKDEGFIYRTEAQNASVNYLNGIK